MQRFSSSSVSMCGASLPRSSYPAVLQNPGFSSVCSKTSPEAQLFEVVRCCGTDHGETNISNALWSTVGMAGAALRQDMRSQSSISKGLSYGCQQSPNKLSEN
jgi:hypothetical protein